MKTIRTMMNDIYHSGKYNWQDISLWYWDNIGKRLIELNSVDWRNADQDDMGFTIRKTNIIFGDIEEPTIFIPYHRILRITEKNNTIWERTIQLEKLQMVIK